MQPVKLQTIKLAQRRPAAAALAALIDDLQMRLISQAADTMRGAGLDEAEIVKAADDMRMTLVQFRNNIEAMTK